MFTCRCFLFNTWLVALEGRRGAADGHSDPFYKKVLSSKLTKLGEELCDNRNAKDSVVLCWAERFRRSKTQVFLSKAVFLSQNHWILMCLPAAAAVWCWTKEQPD